MALDSEKALKYLKFGKPKINDVFFVNNKYIPLTLGTLAHSRHFRRLIGCARIYIEAAYLVKK